MKVSLEKLAYENPLHGVESEGRVAPQLNDLTTQNPLHGVESSEIKRRLYRYEVTTESITWS